MSGSTTPLSTRCSRAPLHEFKDWEKVPYFDGCLPIEVMAERGRETLRFGPIRKPEIGADQSATIRR